MADVHEPEVRSYNMNQIKGKDTKPELLLKSVSSPDFLLTPFSKKQVFSAGQQFQTKFYRFLE
ncbi:MAG: hypothetical protein IIB82_17760 [Bacteroidetes bacterium]|nr:hypothetical protein [Bacteroidota bacterium]